MSRYHGLPLNLLPFNPSPKGDYLAFLGRIAPEKGPERAIEIATRAGAKLKMAAKVDPLNQSYTALRVELGGGFRGLDRIVDDDEMRALAGRWTLHGRRQAVALGIRAHFCA